MKMKRAGLAAIIGVLVLAGCAGKGERVNLVIPGGAADPKATSVSDRTLRVVVTPFDDARSDRAHLGIHSDFWGGTRYYDLSKGTVGEAVAKTLVQELNKRGWLARMAGQGDLDKPDATISGSIREASVMALGKLGRTEIMVKNAMVLRVANHGDESTVREQVLGSGTDEVFWFNPEDAEQLVNEVLRKNIEKFLIDTTVEGRAVRLK